MSGILQGVEHSALVCLQYSKHVSEYFFFWQFAPLLIAPLLIPVLLNPIFNKKSMHNSIWVHPAQIHPFLDLLWWIGTGSCQELLLTGKGERLTASIAKAVLRYVVNPSFHCSHYSQRHTHWKDTLMNKAHLSSRATSEKHQDSTHLPRLVSRLPIYLFLRWAPTLSDTRSPPPQFLTHHSSRLSLHAASTRISFQAFEHKHEDN